MKKAKITTPYLLRCLNCKRLIKEPRYQCHGIDSASLCSLAGRYNRITLFNVPAGKDTLVGGIDSLESISGLLKRLEIRALAENTWEAMESHIIRSTLKTKGVEVRMVDERIQ